MSFIHWWRKGISHFFGLFVLEKGEEKTKRNDKRFENPLEPATNNTLRQERGRGRRRRRRRKGRWRRKGSFYEVSHLQFIIGIVVTHESSSLITLSFPHIKFGQSRWWVSVTDKLVKGVFVIMDYLTSWREGMRAFGTNGLISQHSKPRSLDLIFRR